MNIIKRLVSGDKKAVKYLFATKDNFSIETLYVDHPNKHIICFSSQIGCVISCIFCVTGTRSKNERYRRSLTKEEIMEQCFRIIDDRHLQLAEKPILFSCMGEGEPFLNFQNVVSALQELGNPNSRLAISTSGIKPELIRSLAEMNFPAPIKLQVSLHAPNDRLRGKLITVTRCVKEIVDAVKYYRKTCNRPVDWNYILIDGINDSKECAIELAQLLGSGEHVKFNALNPAGNEKLKPAETEQISEFMKVLEKHGLTTEYYETDGTDICGACGQLAYGLIK